MCLCICIFKIVHFLNYSLPQLLRLQIQLSPGRPASSLQQPPVKDMFCQKAKSCQTLFLLVELMLGYCIHILFAF